MRGGQRVKQRSDSDRSAVEYARYEDRKVLAAARRPIYAAASEETARQALQDFATDLGARSIRRSCIRGNARGSTSCRSTYFRRRFGGSFIRTR